MSFFDSFHKLHVGVRSILFSVFAVFPFYFVAIYLFEHHLFDKFNNKPFFINDFRVIFIFSLCFICSLTWVMTNFCVSFVISSIGDKITKVPHDTITPLILTFVYSILYISLVILFNYRFTKFTLITFSVYSHLGLFIRLLYTYFVFNLRCARLRLLKKTINPHIKRFAQKIKPCTRSHKKNKRNL